MQKLSSVEGERVMAVLKSAYKSCYLASVVPATPSDEVLHALETVRGSDELVTCLEDQWQLEEGCNLKSTIETKDGSPEMAPRAILSRMRDRAKDADDEPTMERALHVAVRKSVRKLQVSADEAGMLADYSKGTGTHGMSFFLSILKRLSSIMMTKLCQTTADLRVQYSKLEELRERREGAEKDMVLLDAELMTLRKTRYAEAGALDSQIKALRSELEDVQTRSLRESETLAKQVSGAVGEAAEEHGKNTTRLEADIATMRKELDGLAEKHSTQERLLRKRCTRLRLDIDSQIEKYDEFMMEHQQQIDALTVEGKRDRKLLDVLEEHFVRIDAELARVKEETDGYASVHRAAEKVKTMRVMGAAYRIQAIWKGGMVRTFPDQFLPKKGKKGKKGKR